MAIDAPNRAAMRWEVKRLAELDSEGTCADQPEQLVRTDIQQAPSLFQPRHDSIAYAPGRSEAHVVELAKVVKRGTPLDPVTVVGFGKQWYLIDGHHRLAAYAAAGWSKPIPVRAVHSDLRGASRVNWAIKLSVADNAKNRLNISTADKVDAAWQAVVRGADTSKADMIATYGVSDGTVAAMRRVRKELEAGGIPPALCTSWRMAKRERERLADAETMRPHNDMQNMLRRQAAKRLQPVMEMQMPPGQLAEALEQFSPGIVEAMAAAWRNAAAGSD